MRSGRSERTDPGGVISDTPGVRALVTQIREQIRAAADPARAPQMQAYMKSVMPYAGTVMPELKRIVRKAAREHQPGSLVEIIEAVSVLWREAEVREERYAAYELTGLPRAKGCLELLPIYTEMIETGAWWDHVDSVAHRIDDLLLAHRDTMGPLLREWSTSSDLWLRRSSIIAQLSLKERTDTDLLRDVLVVNLADKEFFIRKAIGWALREHSKTDPQWVQLFVAEHHERLSGLSRREALKRINAARAEDAS